MFSELSKLESLCYEPLNFLQVKSLSADKFDLLWINLLQTCLKHVFSIIRKLNF